MRVGVNPSKADNEIVSSACHRIIIPVFIPDLSNYFKHALDILKLCLAELIGSLPESTVISIINNNSCAEVTGYLHSLFVDGKVDRLIFNQKNVGRTDAIIAEMRSTDEELITVMDADVLMRPGWLEEAKKIFQVNARVGCVSFMPDPSKSFDFTSFTILYGIFTKRLTISAFTHGKSWKRFILGLGQDFHLYSNKIAASNIFVLKLNSEVNAAIGGHHFAATYHRSYLQCVPKKKSYIKAGGHASYQYFDIPVDRAGMLKLSTIEPFCVHVGNTLEEWMIKPFSAATNPNRAFANNKLPKRKRFVWLPYKVRIALAKLYISGLRKRIREMDVVSSVNDEN